MIGVGGCEKGKGLGFKFLGKVAMEEGRSSSLPTLCFGSL